MRVKPDSLLECLVEGDRGGDMRVFELIEYVGCWQIVLQKSQNAVRLNFRQRTKQAVIVGRCRFNRATEVISEFVTE
jgi:hypothetical protein